ncbi:MAG: hypothetical protein M0R80_07975 [Proteobacteria bacterium]|jgi:hypothetical protein|nr:hypothetical protein [Pseudomonadota bacterium]
MIKLFRIRGVIHCDECSQGFLKYVGSYGEAKRFLKKHPNVDGKIDKVNIEVKSITVDGVFAMFKQMEEHML